MRKENEHEIDLGSCQYEEAARIYAELFEKTDAEVAKIVTFKRLPSISIKQIVKDLKSDLSNAYDKEAEKELNEALDKCETVEDLFDTFRNEAWDLWSAAPVIAGYFFDWGFNIEEIEHTVAGPIFNQLAQGENPDTAVALFLLSKFEIVKDESCYSDFDT